MVSNNNANPSVLVILATGKTGRGVTDAFVESDKYQVFGTTRTKNHPELLAKGITPIVFGFGSTESIQNALAVSKASIVVLITAYPVSKTAENEFQHAKLIIDACRETDFVKYIFYPCSSALASKAKEYGCIHLEAKPRIEAYMNEVLSSRGINYTVLEPAIFMENFDDPSTYNPLKRGYVKGIFPADRRIPMVSTYDIGKALIKMVEQPDQWNGKTYRCTSCFASGMENAEILSRVSGIRCVYGLAIPSFLMRWFLPELVKMVHYIKVEYNDNDEWDPEIAIQDFKQLVPDALDCKEWFERKGKWSDGTKFGEDPPPVGFFWKLLGY